MSIHSSLKLKNILRRSRSVFTRSERLQFLEKEVGRSPADSVYGLPKVRTRLKAATRKKGPPKDEGEEVKN